MESPLSTWLGDGDYDTVCTRTQDTSMASCDLRTFWEQMDEGEWSSPSVFLSPFHWTLGTLPHFHQLSELNPPTSVADSREHRENQTVWHWNTTLCLTGIEGFHCQIAWFPTISPHHFCSEDVQRLDGFPGLSVLSPILRDSNTFLLSLNSLESTRL